MINTPPIYSASIHRRVRLWKFIIFGGTIAALTTVNVFTELSDKANDGRFLSPWQPVITEYSSALFVWALIPVIGLLSERFVLSARNWKYIVPMHLVATILFSIIHVSGMIALRKLAYQAIGMHYHFGPPLVNWIYEYRKDVVTYCLIFVGLYAFHIYRLWLESHLPSSAAVSTPAISVNSGLERLVVKKLSREYVLNTADIDHIDAAGNYVNLYLNGVSFSLRERLSTLEKKLDSRNFVRVHRGHIVNINRIVEIQPWDSGDYRILLKDGSLINFSRRYRGRISQYFNS